MIIGAYLHPALVLPNGRGRRLDIGVERLDIVVVAVFLRFTRAEKTA